MFHFKNFSLQLINMRVHVEQYGNICIVVILYILISNYFLFIYLNSSLVAVGNDALTFLFYFNSYSSALIGIRCKVF